MLRILVMVLLGILGIHVTYAQSVLKGNVRSKGEPVEYAAVVLAGTSFGGFTDSNGLFEIKDIPNASYTLKISAVGYLATSRKISIPASNNIDIELTPSGEMNEVVVTGTMKEVSRLNSPIPVEVYTQNFFRKNPTPSMFEAVGMINGVRPQLNCNVCNTGDIHINGMEGPYTLVLIDGMPIVSALSTVYGLSGIPNSIVERIEVVKGPAASLYGSEAMGGIVNVITKNPLNAPTVALDLFATSWKEYNADASLSFGIGKTRALAGINYYNYQDPQDKNGDGFTDVTLQNRLSAFNKWAFHRKDKRIASVALRYVTEDRWGGQLNWNRQWRGSDSIYGENVVTNRWEVIGIYQLPVREKIMAQFSWNRHHQDSWYGTMPYMARQQVTFAQLYWDKELGKEHNLLLGSSYRYTVYDDNTPATEVVDSLGIRTNPATTPLPGLFVQDEWIISPKHKLLAGYRYDYDRNHGNIHSPRLAWKFDAGANHVLRTSFGTGFRVVNLFTEDHAALTGARKVEIAEALKPERSYNGNVNYIWKIPAERYFINIDATAFYSYFTNKIVGDFITDPDKIIYDNLRGHAVSRGVSLNTEATFNIPLKISAGLTWQDVYQMEDHGTSGLQKNVQWHAPRWTGNYLISYTFTKPALTIDFTGQWNGPMRLPIQPNDFRPEYSPWFTLANVQLTKKFSKGLEVYGGIKNLFNFIPRSPLMRPFDPFDKTAGDKATNPYGYTFDTEYNYAPLQGFRVFLGMRYNLFTK